MLSITVLSNSTLRVLASCANVKQFFTIEPVECHFKAKRQIWFQKHEELIARQVSFFLRSARCWMTLFILWSGVADKNLYHGDILLEINGTSLKGLTEQQVNM